MQVPIQWLHELAGEGWNKNQGPKYWKIWPGKAMHHEPSDVYNELQDILLVTIVISTQPLLLEYRKTSLRAKPKYGLWLMISQYPQGAGVGYWCTPRHESGGILHLIPMSCFNLRPSFINQVPQHTGSVLNQTLHSHNGAQKNPTKYRLAIQTSHLPEWRNCTLIPTSSPVSHGRPH
jgi:hypothetical protein